MTPQPSPPYRPEPTPFEVVRAERFRQLEQVREHHERSARAQFLPPVALGAWIAAGVFLADPVHQRPLLVAAPLVLAAAAALSARISRRAELSSSARWTALAFVVVVGATVLRDLARGSGYGPAVPRDAALALAAGALALVMLSVHRLAQRGPELAPVVIAMITARQAMRDPVDPDLWFWGALGVYLLALGTFRFVRLQVFSWRLARLRRELGIGPR